jgi:cobalt/nickel transport system ATP-binding protein
LIQAANLTVRYNVKDEKPALGGLNFSVNPGERIALMGANGAGKSTLLLSLSGVLLPGQGELSVDGIPVQKDRLGELRRRVGLLFQNPDDQLFMPTVEEDICFGPRSYGLDEEQIAARLAAVLENLGIGRLKNRLAHHLSGGEKRLAALAGILIMEPSLLLFDEPLSFLDPAARRNLIRILKELPQTMLIATHDPDLALALCGRVIILKEGGICADGPAADLLAGQAQLEQWGL